MSDTPLDLLVIAASNGDNLKLAERCAAKDDSIADLIHRLKRLQPLQF